MKRFLLLSVASMILHLATFAVPAYPVRKSLMKADGTMVEVTLRGDENIHYYQTQDGQRLRLEQDRLYPISEMDYAMMQSRAQQKEAESAARREARVRKKAPYVGQKKGLVILVSFSDNDFSIPDPKQTYSDYFNKKGYTDYGMTGSVSDYFLAQSYGQFQLAFDIVGPYKLSRPMRAYGGAAGDSHDINPHGMIEEAVKLAAPDVNYWEYDWDKDSEVDQVFVIYAGYGEAQGGAAETIWPHESSIASSNIMLDGTRIGTYACSCELKSNTGAQLDGIGTACHEFSHCLGIRDHYDTQGQTNFGMGNWDLMCSGSYNNGSRTPAAYTAYERWVSGWLEPVEVNEKTEIKAMKPLVDAPEAYILYNEGDYNEYYILENRQQKGFDAGLLGHGLLVVHVDYEEGRWRGNTVNVGDKQCMTIIAADNEYGQYYTSSFAGDPFPGSKQVTSLTDYTTPAATLIKRNKDRSYLMHKAIESIAEDADGLVSMTLCGTPLVAPEVLSFSNVTATSFRVAWDAVEGATEYELNLDESAKKGSLESAQILKEDFSSCYSKSAGFTDISSKNLGSYLPGFTGSKLFTTPDYLRIGTGTSSGYLYTPVMEALKTGDLTIVMKVKPYKSGQTVKGEVKITTNTSATCQTFDLNFDKEGTLVFRSNVKFTEIYRVDIVPTGAMYIQGLELYDGHFTDAELGLNTVAQAPRRVSKARVKTTDTYYDFKDLDPNCTYMVAVRALDGDRSSTWSTAFSVEDAVFVSAPEYTAPKAGAAWYDLQGRPVTAPTRGLYIHGGKKILK